MITSDINHIDNIVDLANFYNNKGEVISRFESNYYEDNDSAPEIVLHSYRNLEYIKFSCTRFNYKIVLKSKTVLYYNKPLDEGEPCRVPIVRCKYIKTWSQSSKFGEELTLKYWGKKLE